jgi:hypothetical protein
MVVRRILRTTRMVRTMMGRLSEEIEDVDGLEMAWLGSREDASHGKSSTPSKASWVSTEVTEGFDIEAHRPYLHREKYSSFSMALSAQIEVFLTIVILPSHLIRCTSYSKLGTRLG